MRAARQAVDDKSSSSTCAHLKPGGFARRMSMYRYIAFAVAAASAAAMLYVGLYQSRLVGRLICPFFGEGCEGVANAQFARPFGIPDGYIGAVLYIIIIALLFVSPHRWVWIVLLVLSGAATLANVLGVRDMMIFGGYCFYCLSTAILSPVLLWSVWKLG
jgi:uncharacterized membrane protein